jgi:hypothetical protein
MKLTSLRIKKRDKFVIISAILIQSLALEEESKGDDKLIRLNEPTKRAKKMTRLTTNY